MKNKPLNIVIAGGGIGGITAALCLHKAGHQVTVLERNQTTTTDGAGIQLGANALRVLDYLGLIDRLRPLAVEPSSVLFRDHSTGDVLYRMDLGQRYQQQYGLPYWHLHRGDLLSVLTETWLDQAPRGLRFGTQVQAYVEHVESVEVELNTGGSLECDLLIGADGIRSGIRQQLIGPTKPHYTGNVAWRATVATSTLPPDWMDTVTTNFMGPGSHVVLYYLRDKKLANFVGVVEQTQPIDNTSWVTLGDKQQLLEQFQGWHTTVQAMLDAIPSDACYQWSLYDHSPLDTWSSRAVTLLGDAAHATLPFMASGAALAIEDARILQRALSQADSIDAGLHLYQFNRLQRTAKVQAQSRDFGKIYHIRSKWARRLAFSGIRLLGPLKEPFLPSYDANTIALNPIR